MEKEHRIELHRTLYPFHPGKPVVGMELAGLFPYGIASILKKKNDIRVLALFECRHLVPLTFQIIDNLLDVLVPTGLQFKYHLGPAEGE